MGLIFELFTSQNLFKYNTTVVRKEEQRWTKPLFCYNKWKFNFPYNFIEVVLQVIVAERRAGLLGFRNLETEGNFSLLPNVHTSSGAHPVSNTIGAFVILRGKCGRGVTLTPHFHPNLRLRTSGATNLLLVCLEGEYSDNFCVLST